MTTYPIDSGNEKTSSASDLVIRLDRVGKKYPLAQGAHHGGLDFWALKDVSCEVQSGQILGVIGRNGGGKTTLLNILAGVLSLTEGEVTVRGKALGLFNLGVGFQDELTGRENIFLNASILGASRQQVTARFDAIVAFSELGDFIDMPLGTYSQGMRLRLGFSIVANLDFDILVIDEVLAVGDALFQSKCYERLMDFKRAGKTLILTTQGMEMVERLCDQVILLDHGKLMCSGKAVEVIDRYRALLNTEQFYVGPPKEADAIFENTKKWMDDISEWGKKLGTKETVIRSVEFLNCWGFKNHKIKSGQPWRIRVVFDVRNPIKEPHFGVAIFRSDGVYCYGPNTQFDRRVIREIRPGRSWFEISYEKVLLAPGDYKISVAIWDKNEALPFDYHSGCYDLKVLGSDVSKELLNIPCKINGHKSLPSEKVPVSVAGKDAGEGGVGESGIKIASAQWVEADGVAKDVLRTRESGTLKIAVVDTVSRREGTYLWVGLFREDDVYCQGFVAPYQGTQRYDFAFGELPLLPGGYKVSVGVWSVKTQEFLARRDNAVPFRMIFDKEDHGTVHLKHVWKWELSQ